MGFLTKSENRAIAGLAGIFSLRMLGLFMILPVFALYAQELEQVTPLRIGIALGIYGLTQAMFQIPFGMASDRLGRKPIIIIGLLLFIVGSVLAAVSDSIIGVMIGRALQGAGAVGCVIMALAADLTREVARTRAMAGIGITIGLSFALAMVLGPLLNEWVGVRGIFWLSAIFSLLGIFVLLCIVPGPLKQVDRQQAMPAIGLAFRTLCKNSTFVQATVGILVLHASLTALFLKMPQQSGMFYLGVLCLSFIATAVVIMYAEKHKSADLNKKLLLISVILLILSECIVFYFILPTCSVQSGVMGLALGLCLFFTAFNFLEANLPSLVSKCVSAQIKGTALGVFSCAQFLGLFLGGAIGGWLDNFYANSGIAGFCVILGVIWLKLISMPSNRTVPFKND